MKDLSIYITEKRKLSDINKDHLDRKWVKADKLKFNDLKEGNIVLLKNGNYYILEKDNIAGILLKKESYQIKGKYYLIRKNEDNRIGYSYLNFTDDYKNFPSHYGSEEFDIVKVYQRERKYNTEKELRDDLDLLYDGYLIK